MAFKQFKNFAFTCKFAGNDMTNIVSTKEGANWKRLSFPVTDGVSTQFVELFGGQYSTIKTFSKVEKGEKAENIEIAWEDRNKKEVIDTVALFKRFRLNLGEEKEFIAEYDFIEAVQQAAIDGKLKDVTLYITGNVKFDQYNGKITPKFQIQSLAYAKGDNLLLGGNINFVFDKDSLDVTSGKEKRQIYIDGYVSDYVKDLGRNMFLKQTFVFDYSELPNNAVTYIHDKFKVKKGYHSVLFNVKFFKGAEEVAVELTKEQQELISFGMLTEEQAKKDNGVKGVKYNELRLLRPITSGLYSNFTIEHGDLTEDDFIAPVKEEVINLDDLFGASTIEFDDSELPF